MEDYKMAVDVEAGLGDVYRATVDSGKPSRSGIWKLLGVLFLIALCAGASFLFAWHFTSHSQKDLHKALQNAPATAQQQQILTQIANKTKAAIHLHVSVQWDQKQPLVWENGVDQSFSSGGLKLENNQIVIPSDGLYYVYSQASFDVPCDDDDDDSSSLLMYSIRWSSPSAPSENSPKYLLKGEKSACRASSEEVEESKKQVLEMINLSAVFRLYKGDKLSTEICHPEHVEKESSKTFFGVFEL